MSFAFILGPAHLITAPIAVNFVAFAMFGIDKAKAKAGKRRIAESTLLLLAFVGGTPGAYAGRAVFRHKTRKQPFTRELHTIAAMQGIVIGLALGWMLAG